MKKGLHKFKKVCYDNPRWETSIAIWACSSVGRAYGSHPYGHTSTCEFQPMILERISSGIF